MFRNAQRSEQQFPNLLTQKQSQTSERTRRVSDRRSRKLRKSTSIFEAGDAGLEQAVSTKFPQSISLMSATDRLSRPGERVQPSELPDWQTHRILLRFQPFSGLMCESNFGSYFGKLRKSQANSKCSANSNSSPYKALERGLCASKTLASVFRCFLSLSKFADAVTKRYQRVCFSPFCFLASKYQDAAVAGGSGDDVLDPE